VIAFLLYLRSGEDDFFYYWGAKVPRLIWILWFIFGAGTLLIGLTRKVKTSETFDHTLICTGCFQVYEPSDVIDNTCPDCKGQIESIKAFYKENPDFMEKIKKT
jgi:hypothetical protein